MSVDPVSLAVEAALVAANMALQASQHFYGPRVNATPVTVADYGTSLNYFRGTRLLPGPCFFAKPIQEKKKTRKGKGGKQTTYTGFGSWAIHVADHAIGGILQVWFDDHLVYDATGSSTKIYPLADDYELTASMRVYTGSETQDPDPDMEAYIEARDGTGTCPAYRGTSYVYFQDVPLEQLGNRYPDVKVLAYQDSALKVADTAGIEFVGQQQVSQIGNTSPDVTFALTDGSGAAPAAGDLVIIVVSSTRYPLATDTYHKEPVGYTALTDLYSAESLIDDFTWRAYYKVMGDTPDTTFTPGAIAYATAANAFQIMVFRGVDAPPLASEITMISGTGPASYHPAGIELGPAIFDPGDIGGTAVSAHYLFASMALNSVTSGQALPLVLGGASAGGAFESVGNMLAIYQFDTSGGTRDARAYALYGRELLIGEGTTLEAVLTEVAVKTGLDTSEYDFSLATQEFDGYNWTQATGRQICEALCDLFDVDLRPHDFTWQALPRGTASSGSLPNTEFVPSQDQAYTLSDKADTDMPRRVFVTYADTTAGQTPNVAMPAGQDPSATGTQRETSIDMTTLAITPTVAQPLSERWLRRQRFGRWDSSFGLTRQRIGIEPGDVWTPSFDGDAMVMRCKKFTLGADGTFSGEWERDDPAIAVLPSSEGAAAAGYIPDTVPTGVDSTGAVLDVPLLVDAHDQTAPLAYLVAGPSEPGTWTGADFARSDDGTLDSYATNWDGIAAADGAVIGTCTAGLGDAQPWVPDYGNSVEVTINAGELTAATVDELIADGTLNLAAIESGAGWEIVQFMTPTLTGERTYTVTGFLRGLRGTEWAMAGHAADDRFILLADAKRHTLGASEIGDTDYYIVSSTGAAVDQTTAFSLAFTGASHKPYAPVLADVTQSGADWLFDATRRTRIGGTTLDGQDVPLGEASESWALDIYNGASVVRTLTGTSLPLTWTEAQQIADFGSAQGTVDARLYQVDPTLNLRGYPLALAA